MAICEAEGVDIVWAPPVDEVYPAGLRHHGPRRAGGRGRSRARRDPAISTAWRRSSRSCSASSARSTRTSGRRTRSRSWSSAGWRCDLAIPTEVIACPDRPRARRPRAVVAERPPGPGPADRGAGAPSGARPAREAWSAGERSGEALRESMRRELAGEPLADVDYVSIADAATLAELDEVDRAGPGLARGPLRVDAAHRQRAAGLTTGNRIHGRGVSGSTVLAIA